MANNIKPPRQSADPHGYHPILIDEDCLTAEDRREELMESFAAIADPTNRNHGPNIKELMTPAELEIYEEPPRRDSPYRIGNISIEQEEEKYAIARRVHLRAYSREKYANGQSIWYGDGVPFGSPGGEKGC